MDRQEIGGIRTLSVTFVPREHKIPRILHAYEKDPAVMEFVRSLPPDQDEDFMAGRLYIEIKRRTPWVVQRLLPMYLGADWKEEYGNSTARLARQVLKRRWQLVCALEEAGAVTEKPSVQGAEGSATANMRST